MHTRTTPALLLACALLLTPAPAVAEPPAAEQDDEVDALDDTRAVVARAKKDLDFNDDGITWRSMGDGLAHAKKTGKPVLLIAYATWCSACRQAATYFHDDALVRLADQFVMVRVDVDSETEGDAVAVLTPGETYVPRVVFLDASGKPRADVVSGSDEYPHFYSDLEHLVATMKRSLTARPPGR